MPNHGRTGGFSEIPAGRVGLRYDGNIVERWQKDLEDGTLGQENAPGNWSRYGEWYRIHLTAISSLAEFTGRRRIWQNGLGK